MNLHPLIKKLSAFRDPGGATVTLALDLSGSGRLPVASRVFLKDQVYENLASEARPEKVRSALKKLSLRIRDFVEKKVRPGTDGLFLTAGPGLWEAVELLVPLRNLVVVGRTPYLAPLVEALRRAPRAYAVEIRAGGARIEELHLGERRELARIPAREVADNVEHATAIHGGAERDLQQRRKNAVGRALAKEAAARVAVFHREGPAEAILVSEATEAFVSQLPAALRERVLEGTPEILETAYAERVATEVLAFKEARQEGLRAALGPRDVLEALRAGAVERVYLDPDEPFPGVVCEACKSRFPELHRRCPACEGDVVATSLTQEIVAHALAHPPMDITFVKGRPSWLKDLGGMAALLRRKGARRSKLSSGILASR